MADHCNSVPEHYEEGKRNRKEKSRVVTVPNKIKRITWWAELPLPHLEQDLGIIMEGLCGQTA